MEAFKNADSDECYAYLHEPFWQCFQTLVNCIDSPLRDKLLDMQHRPSVAAFLAFVVTFLVDTTTSADEALHWLLRCSTYRSQARNIPYLSLLCVLVIQPVEAVSDCTRVRTHEMVKICVMQHLQCLLFYMSQDYAALSVSESQEQREQLTWLQEKIGQVASCLQLPLKSPDGEPITAVRMDHFSVGVDTNTCTTAGAEECCFNPFCVSRARVGRFRKCSACKEAVYCSVDCQKQHWPEHKKACSRKFQGAVKKG